MENHRKSQKIGNWLEVKVIVRKLLNLIIICPLISLHKIEYIRTYRVAAVKTGKLLTQTCFAILYSAVN